MDAIHVRASEFSRRFGQLSQVGRPVFITHHGRETHALLPIADYRDILETSQLGECDRAAQCVFSNQGLADWLPLVLIVTDEAGTILLANRTAQGLALPGEKSLQGRALVDVWPTLSQTIFESYYSHTLRSGEPCSFELPAMFAEKNSWHRVDTIRTGRDVLILARDITEDVRAHRLADTRRTLIDALRVHGGIGYAWFNVRGRINEADPGMCSLLQLPAERLANVPFSDLAPIALRVALRDATERALTRGEASRLETEFIRNDGTTIPVTAAIRDLRGPYGCEGGVLIATLR